MHKKLRLSKQLKRTDVNREKESERTWHFNEWRFRCVLMICILCQSRDKLKWIPILEQSFRVGLQKYLFHSMQSGVNFRKVLWTFVIRRTVLSSTSYSFVVSSNVFSKWETVKQRHILLWNLNFSYVITTGRLIQMEGNRF